jgi:hypothetical protein
MGVGIGNGEVMELVNAHMYRYGSSTKQMTVAGMLLSAISFAILQVNRLCFVTESTSTLTEVSHDWNGSKIEKLATYLCDRYGAAAIVSMLLVVHVALRCQMDNLGQRQGTPSQEEV